MQSKGSAKSMTKHNAKQLEKSSSTPPKKLATPKTLHKSGK